MPSDEAAVADDQKEGATQQDVLDVMDDITSGIPAPDGVDTDGNDDDPGSDSNNSASDDSSSGNATGDDSDGSGDDGSGVDELDLIDELTGVKSDDGDDSEEPEDDGLSDEDLKAMPEGARNAFILQRQRIRDLKAKVESANSSAEDTDVVKELRAEVEKLQGRLGASDLRQDPEFIRRYSAPINRKLQTIGATIHEMGENPKDVISKAMAFRSKVERKRFLQETVPSFATELSIMFADVDTLVADRSNALKNSTAASKALAADAAKRRADSVGKIFDESVDSLSQENHFLYRTKDGNEKWNGQVEQRKAAAKDLIGRMAADETEMVKAALKANSANDLLSLFLQERKARKALEAQLKTRKGMAPSLGGDGDSKRNKPGSDKDALSGMEVADLISGRDYGKGSIQ